MLLYTNYLSECYCRCLNIFRHVKNILWRFQAKRCATFYRRFMSLRFLCGFQSHTIVKNDAVPPRGKPQWAMNCLLSEKYISSKSLHCVNKVHFQWQPQAMRFFGPNGTTNMARPVVPIRGSMDPRGPQTDFRGSMTFVCIRWKQNIKIPNCPPWWSVSSASLNPGYRATQDPAHLNVHGRRKDFSSGAQKWIVPWGGQKDFSRGRKIILATQ